jgi:lysophospholipase L1-like esterase
VSSRLRTALGPAGPWILWILFVLAIQLVVALCSESAVGEALAGRGPRWFARFAASHPGRSAPELRLEIVADLRSLQLVATALFALYLVARLHLAVWRKPKLLPLSVLFWWLAVELLVAPHLSFGDWTMHYRLIHGLDHRPTEVGGRFNSDSVVATEESSAFRPEDLNLVFLGDSFTMGYLLSPGEDAFPTLVGARIARDHPEQRVHVANFGWVSSSPFLSHRRLVDIGEKYAPDLVVMALDMTDFADDLRYQRVLEQRGIYWFYDKVPLTLRMLSALAPATFRRLAAQSVGGVPPRRFFISDAPLEQTRAWMMPLAENCDRTAAWCREHGARFVVLVLPRSYQYSAREVPRNKDAGEYEVLGPHSLEPFRFFDELRPTKPYPIVSLLEDFRANTEFPTCFEDDAHWNALGHRVAARAIARELAPVVDDIVRAGR